MRSSSGTGSFVAWVLFREAGERLGLGRPDEGLDFWVFMEALPAGLLGEGTPKGVRDRA